MILALDTATETASVALYHPDGLAAEHTWRSGRKHTVELMPEVERVLQRAGLKPQALSGVAVTIGPGSFTGLRIALAAAKGLVAVLGVPLFGVPTLEAMAHPLRHVKCDLYPVIQAGRGRYCTARHAPQQAEDLRVGRLEELAGPANDGLWFGELDEAAREELRRRLPPTAEVLGAAVGLHRAGAAAELGWARLQAGQADDPASLSPIYLKTTGLGA